MDGVDNARDVGGLPTTDGAAVRHRRLLRTGNLQQLTERDVHTLLHEVGVTTVVDLRRARESTLEGATPLTDRPGIATFRLSLYPEDPGEVGSGIAAQTPISWEAVDPADHEDEWTGHYLTYLTMRPDSIVAALRAIGTAPGAALVHCAAGKDRTGTVVMLALRLAGVTDEAIVADYAASATWVARILERLRRRPAYAHSLQHATVENQTPRAETMIHLLTALDDRYGGAEGYLRRHGWTGDDTARLRAKLLA